MNTKTGEIKNYDEVGKMEVLEKQMYTKLSQLEHVVVAKLEEEDRPGTLALHRFIEERKKLKAPHDIHIKNAFRLGYKAALNDQKNSKRE